MQDIQVRDQLAALPPRRSGLAAAALALAGPAGLFPAMQVLRFLGVGACGFTVDALSFVAFTSGGMGEAGARASALAVATLVTWLLNRAVTFGRSRTAWSWEALRYAGVAVGAQGINFGVFVSVRQFVPALPLPLVFLGAAAFATLFSFLGQKHVTFGR